MIKLAHVHVFLMTCVVNVEMFGIQCPSASNWNLRAIAKCNSTIKYFCLYNTIDNHYIDGCTGPDWDRIGRKRVIAGGFTRGYCREDRYQPFKFWTNGSSDCVFQKSKCHEEGQTIYSNGSMTDDSSCRCNSDKGYAFISQTKDPCFCKAAEEDCSCYIKECPQNSALSSDDYCSDNIMANRNCDLIRQSTVADLSDDRRLLVHRLNIQTINYGETVIKYRLSAKIAVTVLSVIMLVLFVFVLLFYELIVQQYTALAKRARKVFERKPNILRSVSSYFYNVYSQWRGNRRREDPLTEDKQDGDIESEGGLTDDREEHTQINDTDKVDSKINDQFINHQREDQKEEMTDAKTSVQEQMNPILSKGKKDMTDDNQPKTAVQIHSPLSKTGHGIIKKEEKNHLLLVHLLYQLAVHVVRMKFDSEIHPKKLYTTLNNRVDKEKLKKELLETKKITPWQWSLLYPKRKGPSSADFDLRVMIYVMQTLNLVKHSKHLLTLKDYMNSISQSCDGALLDSKFISDWDSISKILLEIIGPLIQSIETGNGDNVILRDRVMRLHRIEISNQYVYYFLKMVYKYSGRILSKLILEYCDYKKKSLETVLNEEKHDLFHKRCKTISCCTCEKLTYPRSYTKAIPEDIWMNIFHEIKPSLTNGIVTNSNENHSLCDSKTCKDCFRSKSDIELQASNLDISLASCICLHIPDLFECILDKLYRRDFHVFMNNHKHTLYHAKEKEKCCKCDTDPDEEIILNQQEWNSLFKKCESQDAIKCTNANCCCKYTARLKQLTDYDHNMWCKIFSLVGPFHVIISSGKKAFNTFLRGKLDEDFVLKMTEEISAAQKELMVVISDQTFKESLRKEMCDESADEETMNKEIRNWIDSSYRKLKDEEKRDLLKVLVDVKGNNYIYTWQNSATFRLRGSRQPYNLAVEECRFLKCVLLLFKVAVPVVRHVFDKRFSVDKLHDTLTLFLSKCQGKINLTERNVITLLQVQKEKSSKFLNLRLMIYILKIMSDKEINHKLPNTDDYSEDGDLSRINYYRRKIVQSSKGKLSEKQFQIYWDRINQAISRLGGNTFEKICHDLEKIPCTDILDI